MAGNSADGRSVTSKVTALLDAFLPSAHELSLNDLARRADLPLSTAYRLVSQLVQWGGLERCETGGYRVGLLLAEIGSLAAGGGTLQAVVMPYLRDLHAATGESVQLAVLSGRQVLYLERLPGPPVSVVGGGRGVRLPLHASAAGKVLLAHAPSDFIDDLIDAGLKQYTEYTLTSASAVRRDLAEIRRMGVGFAREELAAGSISIAAPVFDSTGTIVAALSLTTSSARSGPARFAPAVRAVSLGACRELRSRSIRVQRSS